MAFFRSVAMVGLLTLLSRLFGFLRDLMTANLMGAGPVADAFVVAQRLPNAFRSIFAEGAMDTAFVPIYTRKRRLEVPEHVAAFVNHIFTIQVLLLLPLTVLAIIFIPPIVALIAPGFSGDAERFGLAVTYSRITFSFLFLISMTALQGGLLNANRHFIPLAAAPAVMNIVMIGGYLVAIFFKLDAGLCGSWSMIAGGVVQVIMLQIACRRVGLALRFARPRLSQDVIKFFKLVGPGVIGAGSDQVNILVSTMMASTLPSGVIASLYYADRLDQLPMGVIGGAIATTLLPVLTHHVSAKEDHSVVRHFSRAIELGLIFCLPACLILAFASFPIVRILFLHGAFDEHNAKVTAEIIIGNAFSIPGSILVRIFTIRFYAHEDTKTPVLIGLISIVVNAVAAYIFKGYWQHIGIALAFALTMAINAVLLWFMLHKRQHDKLDADAKRRLPPLIVSVVLMGILLWLIGPIADASGHALFTSDFMVNIVALFIRLFVGIGGYLMALQLTGGMRWGEFRALIKQP